DRDLATKLYANMYEQPILKKIQAERKKTAELEEQINKEGKETARIRTEIINRDGDIAKISKENRKLAKQITELTSYQVLIDTAKRLSKTLPQELNDEKQMLDNSIEGFKVSIDTNDNKAINANKVALDQMVDVISDKLVSVKARKQVVISAQKQVNAYKKVLLKQKSQINQLEDAVDIAQDVAYEINQKYEKSVKRNLNKRAENKYWKNRAESAENAVNVLSDTQLEAQYWQDRAQNAETNVDIMYNNLLNSEEKYKKSVKRNLNKRAENKYWKNRAESAENAVNALSDTQLEAQYWQDRAQNAENTVNVVYDNLTETEQQLSQSKAQASKYKSKSKKATRLIAKLVNDTQVQQTENDRLQQEKELAGIFLDGFMEENEILKTELDDTKKAKDETTKQLDRAKKANKRVADKLESINKKHMASKVKIKEQDNIIKAQGEKINNLNEDVDNLVNAQSQNIATISELEIDKDILQDKLTKETSRAKANEDLAINLGYDLQRTQRELDALTSERDAYKKGVEDLEDEKRELKKQLEQALDRADILQAREDAKNANFVRGGLLRNLNNLVDKIDAHIEYTKEVQKDNCDKELLKELQGFTNIVRRKDQNEMSNEDIALSNQVLKKTYGVYRDKLAKVSSEKLRQVIKDKVNSRKINLTK
ncbi:MAG: hypothetical protein IJ458_04890, partial [Clostridia bacterium]|nr:hypothetical protein [Clostridia bacterium]